MLFETNAKLTNSFNWAPNFGAINVNGKSFVTLDGGSNGIIENTGNGSALAVSNDTSGIFSDGGSSVTVQNFNINNMYVMAQPPTFVGDVGAGITIRSGSNNTVTGNTIHDAENCLNWVPIQTDSSNLTITNNKVYHCRWGVVLAVDGIRTVNGVTITGNDVSDGYIWDEPANNYHMNGIMVYGNAAGTLNTLVICNNNVHGNFGVQETGHIFVDANGLNMPGALFCNNVLTSTANGPSNGYITSGTSWVSNAKYLNNTISGVGGGHGIDAGNGATIKNNIMSNLNAGIVLNSGITLTASDYNVLYNLTQGMCPSSGCQSVATWISTSGFDGNSQTSNPNLTSAYMLQLSSTSAIGKGQNQSGLSISLLDTGAPEFFGPSYACGVGCTSRPSGATAWDIGAYPFSSFLPGVTLSASSHNYGQQNTGTSSSPFTFTLTNSGTATLNISGITLTGTNPGDYAISSTCGSTLSAGASQ